MKAFTYFLLTSILILSSCRKFKEEEVVAKAEPFKPTNIYPVERLPLHFTRVVLLPCFHPDSDSTILKFCDQVFYQELAQERIFEIIHFQQMIYKIYSVTKDCHQQEGYQQISSKELKIKLVLMESFLLILIHINLLDRCPWASGLNLWTLKPVSSCGQ